MKSFRELFNVPKQLVIGCYPKGLLTQKEIESIVATLRSAKAFGQVGNMHYEFHKGPNLPFEGKGELIFVTPKDEPLATAQSRIQTVLDREYGPKYHVEI
jgi:hypothetical protein